MQRKVFALLSIVVLLSGLFGVGSVQAAPKPPDYSPVDVGPKLRSWEATPTRIAPISPARLGSRGGRGPGGSQCLRDRLRHGEQIWLILNDYLADISNVLLI